MSITLKPGLQIGSLALVRPTPSGSWECLCICSQKVVRTAHTLRNAVRLGQHSACAHCNVSRARGKCADMGVLRTLERMDEGQKRRVVRVLNGRRDSESVRDAVDIVKRNLDLETVRAPEDYDRRDYRSQYRP